jgi:hypothetical protein
MRTGRKHESVTVRTKGEYKTSNVVSTSKAVTSFLWVVKTVTTHPKNKAVPLALVPSGHAQGTREVKSIKSKVKNNSFIHF